MKFLLALLLVPFSLYPQTDSIVGKPRMVREKIIFAKEEKRPKGALHVYSDYGEFGLFPKSVIPSLTKLWYNTPGVRYVNYRRRFDRRGNLIDERWYNKDGSLNLRQEHRYDAKGNHVMTNQFDESGIEWTRRYSYNQSNLPIAEILLYHDDSDYFLYCNAGYDDKNRQSWTIWSDHEGKCIRESIEYGKGYKRVWVQYNSCPQTESAGERYLHKEILYDSVERIIREREFDRAPFLLRKDRSITYADGKVSVDSLRQPRLQSLSVKRYEYSDGNHVKMETEVIINNERLPDKIILRNYRDGRLIGFTIDEGNVRTNVALKYRFDKRGNWTRQTKFVNGKKSVTRKRKIRYYE